jgi:Holliday junction resolvasome RuvABC endonuclease subunit
MGVDPSSTTTGYAIVEHPAVAGIDLAIHECTTYTSNPKQPIEVNMAELISTLTSACANILAPPDVMIVEKVSVRWNVNTVRKIAYFEAAAMLQAAYWNVPVIQVQATKARRLALGKGNLKKTECYAQVKKEYTQIKYKPFSEGGGDQTDALVLALAGPALYEEAKA